MLVDEIIELLEKETLEETRIIIKDNDHNQLSAVYIYSEIYRNRDYDFIKNSFISITQKKYVSVDFHIDIQSGLIDIWGNKKNAQRIITAISLAFNNNVIIEPCELDVNKMINYLKSVTNIRINKVLVKEIIIESDLLADCIFDLSTKEAPFEVINKYKKNIQRIIFRWEIEHENPVIITLYQSGAVTLHKDRDTIGNKSLEMIYDLLSSARR
jgi:hypothetical protein